MKPNINILGKFVIIAKLDNANLGILTGMGKEAAKTLKLDGVELYSFVIYNLSKVEYQTDDMVFMPSWGVICAVKLGDDDISIKVIKRLRAKYPTLADKILSAK